MQCSAIRRLVVHIAKVFAHAKFHTDSVFPVRWPCADKVFQLVEFQALLKKLHNFAHIVKSQAVDRISFF